MSVKYRDLKPAIVAVVAAGLLSSCSVHQPHNVVTDAEQDRAPVNPPDVSQVPDAVPRTEPLSRYGNPPSYKVFNKQYQVLGSSKGYREKGIASWYGLKFHGRRTSSWEPYDMYKMTAAHKSLPLPTFARVENLENGRQVIVRINDRGPFHASRLIDLSYAAASRLGVLEKGTALVEVTAIDPDEPQSTISEQAVAATVSAPGLFLQVGAFGSKHNALRQKSRLSQTISWPVRIEDSPQQNGATISRVQVGPLPDVDHLDELVSQLDRLGVNDTHVVIR